MSQEHLDGKVLVTGSSGLIGSTAVEFFCEKGFQVVGLDNNQRREFFGPDGDTTWNRDRLIATQPNFQHLSVDIRDSQAVEDVLAQDKFGVIIHCAAQPSHDWAGLSSQNSKTDFEVNALGSFNVAEAARKHAPGSVAIYMSTNKVYGNNPNKLPLKEEKTRYDLDRVALKLDELTSFLQIRGVTNPGISEAMNTSNCTHSLFGVHKLYADELFREYAVNPSFGNLKTGIFRGGCITGPAHSSAQLHGFLAYLVKSVVEDKPYTVIGYKGKQVRDNIHAKDLVNAFWHFIQNPKPGEQYNMGGSRFSHTSILEAFDKIWLIHGRKTELRFIDQPRIGDHIWYVSDIAKFRNHFPNWEYQYSEDDILNELYHSSKTHS